MVTLRGWRKSVDDARVLGAIRAAEARTSGEIRVSVARFFLGDVRRVAERAFVRLGMTATARRNGVLFFVVPSRRAFVVLGDEGIHARAGDELWRAIRDAMRERFRAGEFTDGLVRGIEIAGARLAELFPREAGDVNELPDAIDRGERMGHGHGHEHGHERGMHGNPKDLETYLARLEDPSRVEWQKPDEVLKAMRLAPGMTVGEIGAGPGFFTKRLARAVAPGGIVYAAEVDATLIGVLRDRLKGIPNVVPVFADPDDPRIPPASCDRILVVNTYHHFDDGPAYLRRLAASLKAAGTITNVDFEDRDTPVGPPREMRISRENFVRDLERAGLEVVERPEILPHQYVVTFRPR